MFEETKNCSDKKRKWKTVIRKGEGAQNHLKEQIKYLEDRKKRWLGRENKEKNI